jgi:hypothetical protein
MSVEPNGVIWALSALALGELTVFAAFALITFIFTLVIWPLMFFLKALYTVILGWRI